MYETVVTGSGSAGLNAALYLKRAGKKVIVIEREYEGTGQIAQGIRIENYLGIQELSGEDGITSSVGLFVAADVRTKKLRQVVTAVSDGANAAASAIHHLKFCVKEVRS